MKCPKCSSKDTYDYVITDWVKTKDPYATILTTVYNKRCNNCNKCWLDCSEKDIGNAPEIIIGGKE